MCGICGLVSVDGGSVDRTLLKAMNDTLVHRGPDSGGIFVDAHAGLAARRLAIIDLAGGDQPIQNEDGSVHVVQNGEIYNYRELRRDLEQRGHRFTTHSDTEVLVHLYEERGPRFAEALRGMFAIAIWDARAARLVLARDRFGIKPLYYSAGAGSLSFASELKALLQQPGFSRDIDLEALQAYLAFACIPAPLTIFRDARKLPAGSVLVWDQRQGGDVQIERFARPQALESSVRGRSTEELAEETRERLRDSVRAHLIADVPVGVLLSGGLDSSALTAFAALEAGRVSTFSIGFEERAFDERARARLVAQQYGTDHHELLLRPDAVELLPRIAEVFDEPFGDSSALPTYLVSELTRRDVKVALSGEGGDELFGGYFNYVGHRLAPALGRVGAVLRPLVDRLPTSTASGSSLDYKAKRFVSAARLGPLERHATWKSIFSTEARLAVVGPGRRGAIEPIELLRPVYDESRGDEELARIMDVDLRVFLVEDMLVKTDRASMSQSLEARVPFLDPVVTDFALALPSRHKVRGFTKKRLLRQALAPLLPDEILNGRKRGFSIPVGTWLRGELQPLARSILSPDTIRRQGFFEPQVVTGMLETHIAGKQDLSRQLWSLLVFCLWHDRYVG